MRLPDGSVRLAEPDWVGQLDGFTLLFEALVLIQDAPYAVVLLDIWLPDRDGLDVLSDLRQMSLERRPEVVIISGHGTIETAVKATKLGAYDFLENPPSLDRTLSVRSRSCRTRCRCLSMPPASRRRC